MGLGMEHSARRTSTIRKQAHLAMRTIIHLPTIVPSAVRKIGIVLFLRASSFKLHRPTYGVMSSRVGVFSPGDHEGGTEKSRADPITSPDLVLPARVVVNVRQVKIGDAGYITVSLEKNRGTAVRKKYILGRLVSPPISARSCCAR